MIIIKNFKTKEDIKVIEKYNYIPRIGEAIFDSNKYFRVIDVIHSFEKNIITIQVEFFEF